MNLLQAYRDWQESRRSEHWENGFTSLNLKAGVPVAPGPPFSGFSGMQSYLYQNNSRINFRQEIGDYRNSGLVMAAVGWLARSLCDARFQVLQIVSDQKEQEIQDHPLVQLWDRPNPFYSSQCLLSGLAFSWVTGSEAYIVKRRSSAGLTVQLYWEPNATIEPRWKDSEFISYYEVTRNGVWYRLELDEVIAIRNGIDPLTRRGLLNPEAALLREYFTDAQIAQLCAVLFKKGLIPPGVIGVGDKDFHPDPKDLQAFQNDMRVRMAGDNAGDVVAVSGNVKFQKIGFDYSQIGFRETRHMPEERFSAVSGISVHSLKLSAASQNSTYNNVKQYLEHDYRGYVVPLHRLIANEFNVQLLPDFGSTENVKCGWDYTETVLMQPDKAEEAKRIVSIYEKQIIDRAEAREALGYKMRKEDKGVYYLPASAAAPSSKPEADLLPQAPGAQAPGQMAQGGQVPPMFPVPRALAAVKADYDVVDADLAEGRKWWKKAVPKAAQLVDAEPGGVVRSRKKPVYGTNGHRD